MNNKNWWITLSLVNLAIVALLGLTLRSKILFPMRWIDHEHFINAHSHFAFGGWITLAFFTLFTYTLLPQPQQDNRWYQWMLWGVELTSVGMLLSLPFQGHGPVGTFFSTLFILFTYGYSWRFVRDLLAVGRRGPSFVLALCAIACLVISSAGPFMLAYIMTSGTTDAILFKNTIYYYLHFQYNGFFTLSVFALFFASLYADQAHPAPAPARRFANLLCASVVPSFFLTLLWYTQHPVILALALIGIALILGTLVYFFRLRTVVPLAAAFHTPVARALWLLVLVSFVVKSVLQMGTIFPDLGIAVFGFRPIIIGFLHLIFLGLTSFYILAHYIESGVFRIESPFARFSIWFFTAAVVIQETILMIQGIGLLLGTANPIYNWLLWFIAVALFVGALLMVIARLARRKSPGYAKA
ncbi:MAG TPA: hypothetical protein VGE66_08580 [Chitinophagaceae bacterium]